MKEKMLDTPDGILTQPKEIFKKTFIYLTKFVLNYSRCLLFCDQRKKIAALAVLKILKLVFFFDLDLNSKSHQYRM